MAYTASKVLQIAAGEIGYKEKKSNSQLDNKTANAGSSNYTKYARDFDQKFPNWYNGKKQTAAWCDMFVDWCFLTAFGYRKALELLCQPEHSTGAGCTFSAAFYINKGQFYKSPKPGDQIFFGSSVKNCNHTGLVEKADGSYVYTIEGNADNQVKRCSYKLTDSKIVGYGRPKYDAEQVKPEPKKSVDELAREVIDGKWGVGQDRKDRLTAAGYDYVTVQKRVNEIIKAGSKWTPKVGDTVIFNGGRHYVSAYAFNGSPCKNGKAKITQIYELGKSRHPYHLVADRGGGSTVYGWVDEGTFIKSNG